jgi:hypothetical protein
MEAVEEVWGENRWGERVRVKPWYETVVVQERLSPTSHRNELVAKHEDATVRQSDHGRLPGPTFELLIAIDEDPESGDFFDVDGDRARRRIQMHGASTYLFGDGQLRIEGFVADSEDWNSPEHFRYHPETWHCYPRSAEGGDQD